MEEKMRKRFILLVFLLLILIIEIFMLIYLIKPTLYNKTHSIIVLQNTVTPDVEISKPIQTNTENLTGLSRNLTLNDINLYTDLSPMIEVDVDDMNYIIDYWDTQTDDGTPFKGQGQIFIDAAKESGLDPVYILAHAALETGWGNSKIATTKYNYFGIAAYDHDPYYSSYEMGTDLRSGIISGAKWISENYYKNGQTSLYTMRYNNGEHEYCTSNTWADSILSIIRTSYRILQER